METALPSPTNQLPPAKHAGPPTDPVYDDLAADLQEYEDLSPFDVDLSGVSGATRALKHSNIHKAMRARGLRVSLLSKDSSTTSVKLASEPSRRGRRRLPLYDGIARVLREHPTLWAVISFDQFPGRTTAIKTSGLIAAMLVRGLRVKVQKVDAETTYVHLVEDFGGGR